MQEVRAIEFDENGIPQPVLKTPLPAARMTRLLASALSQQYVPKRIEQKDGTWLIPDDEERFRGLTNAEVGAVRAAEGYARGDIDYTKFVHDRIVGKAKQSMETVTVTATLQDYLKALAQRDAEMTEHVKVEVTEVKTEFELPPHAMREPPKGQKLVEDRFAQLDGI